MPMVDQPVPLQVLRNSPCKHMPQRALFPSMCTNCPQQLFRSAAGHLPAAPHPSLTRALVHRAHPMACMPSCACHKRPSMHRAEAHFGGAQANAVSDKILDLRLCDYSGKDLSGKTLSGALLENAKLPNTNLREAVMSKVGALSRGVLLRIAGTEPELHCVCAAPVQLHADC